MGSDPRSALLEQIRRGTKLNHVDKDSPPPKPPTSHSTGSKPNLSKSFGSGNGRGALLDEIRQGVQLKKVTSSAEEPKAPKNPTTGIAAALKQALAARQKALRGSDDSDSSGDSAAEDDEWD